MKQIKDLSPQELSRFAEWIKEEIDVLSEDELSQMYDNDLDDAYPVELGSLRYSGSYVLKNLDPIAYRCGWNDWTDSAGYFDLCDYSLGDGWIADNPEDLLEDFLDTIA